MFSSTVNFATKGIWSGVMSSRLLVNTVSIYRGYAKERDDGCRRAEVDIPKDPVPCERRKKKKGGILHKIKLKIIEGGTNFGTPFRDITCKEKVCKEVVPPEPKALPAPSRPVPPMPAPRPSVQVSVLGADTSLGQYVALLLKQCPCIKKLRLYEANEPSMDCNRNIFQVAEDLRYIDTNCMVEAFSCACNELERCLQNSDIVLMLENANVSQDLPMDTRFCYNAPLVKRYTDAIAHECPKAFIIVCATPIDCMVPLVTATLKETGWYDPRKVMGSLAVQEMRATTLAARALSLEPYYIRVPCVGGTEGRALVPLFSKAVEYFDFTKQNALMMTETVRDAPAAVARCDGECLKASELSEAHALAGLVTKVAWALLSKDVPRVTGFVETDARQVISPASFMSIDVLINHEGIVEKFDLPCNMNDIEKELMDDALTHLTKNVKQAMMWYEDTVCAEISSGKVAAKTHFMYKKTYSHVEDCYHQIL
ncbi:malate dehydrogenase, mitochondrial-like isoform X1 [Colias croceus]|uniref:malate dehydrogenase, mitochondrial-like isoform X1 n=1 Tax=Colias crocea TaxID=72248 RepID=UPI001E27F0F8|nr:malate dehydrogenase, mitochondrial-like isoform X1 [Colias croceus]